MKNTSWGSVASWYNTLLEEGEGTYQKELILPNLFRCMALNKNETILDLGCGQGFFGRELAKRDINAIGIDVAKELIQYAKKNTPKELESRIRWCEAKADERIPLKEESVDKIIAVLSLQNMENIPEAIHECMRVIKKTGKLYIVLNHPAFRVPKASSWGWDEKNTIQYRRVDAYLGERREKIKMHPSKGKKSATTYSFHRPLQYYIKVLKKNNFCITSLEEWNSHKRSEPGPRAKAENEARKEIPLFLFLEATKISLGNF